MKSEFSNHQTYLLADGRTLSYQLFGDQQGFPLLYCHGFPGSRLEARAAHEAGCDLGACIIAVDRPGFGRSDFQPKRQMCDWVDDIKSLMDALGHQQFSVIGVSGGSPYAMLVGEHLHQRVHRLGIVCGLGSLAKPGSETDMHFAQVIAVRLARRFPKLALIFNRYPLAVFIQQFPNTALKLVLRAGPQVYRDALAKPEIRQIILESIQEAFARGGQGPAWDFYLATQQWQANPAAVKVDTYLWHGNLDTTVPVSMGRRHAELMPHCTAEFLADEGHFSIPLKHTKDILSSLLP